MISKNIGGAVSHIPISCGYVCSFPCTVGISYGFQNVFYKNMKVKIDHCTRYQYEREIYLTTHLLRFKPAAHYNVPIEKFALNITPANHIIHWQQDPFNNFLARVDFTGPLRYLQIDVNIVLE